MIKLAVFDFMILYRLRKTNPADILSYCLNYKGKIIELNKLLSLLQKKLVFLGLKIENALDKYINILYSDIIRIITNLDLQNRKIIRLASLIYRDNNASVQYSVAVLDIIVNMINAYIINSYNEAELLRIRNSQAEVDLLISDSAVTYTPCIRSIANKLNPAAETADCKQFVLCVIIRGLTVHETAIDLLSQSIQELITDL